MGLIYPNLVQRVGIIHSYDQLSKALHADRTLLKHQIMTGYIFGTYLKKTDLI